jgi:hypothetical protein
VRNFLGYFNLGLAQLRLGNSEAGDASLLQSVESWSRIASSRSLRPGEKTALAKIQKRCQTRRGSEALCTAYTELEKSLAASR